MVIDLQPAFSHPDSPWFTPSLAKVARRIETLVPLYSEHVLFTRFVPPTEIKGSWRDYYDKWGFAAREDSAWLWELDDPWKRQRNVASHTFSKWLPETIAHLGPEADVAMCGVSTDCCVMMTALAAVDHGAHVHVIADACAAKSNEIHDSALAMMALRKPQLSIVTIEQEHERLMMSN